MQDAAECGKSDKCRMRNVECGTCAECGMCAECRMRIKRRVEGSKVDHGARRIGIGTRPRNAEVRVLRSNTIWMRLVGALATTFLFRGKSENKKGWQFNDMAVENVSRPPR